MNSQDIWKELGKIDGALAAEADPDRDADGQKSRSDRKSPRKWLKWAGSAAVAVMVLMVGLKVANDRLPRLTDSGEKPLAADLPEETERPGVSTEAETGVTIPAYPDPQTGKSDLNLSSESAYDKEKEAQEALRRAQEIAARIKAENQGLTQHSEAKLVWFSEEELLTRSKWIVRGKVEAIEQVSFPLTASLEGFTQDYKLLTIRIGEVLRGTGVQAGETVCLAVWNFDNYNGMLREAGIGLEGIFLMDALSDTRLNGRADCQAGDGLRFVIWQKAGRLVYERAAFTGVKAEWSLEEAAAYLRSVLQPDARTVPKDFSVFYEIRRLAEVPDYDVHIMYDSAAGTYFREYYEFVEGGVVRRLTDDVVFTPSEAVLRKSYLSFLKLRDLPETASEVAGQGREMVEILLRFTADGKKYEYRYASPRLENMSYQTEPFASFNAIQFEIWQLTTMDHALGTALEHGGRRSAP